MTIHDHPRMDTTICCVKISGDRNTDGGAQVQRNAAFSLLLPEKVLYLNALNYSSMRKFRNRGLEKHGCCCTKMDWGNSANVKARHGSPMVRVHVSPACIYGVTCMSLKTRFMHSIVTQIPWSTCTLWTSKPRLNYWIVSSAFGIQNA